MCVVLKAKNGLSDALVTIKNQQDGLEKTCQIFNEDIEKTEQAIINVCIIQQSYKQMIYYKRKVDRHNL